MNATGCLQNITIQFFSLNKKSSRITVYGTEIERAALRFHCCTSTESSFVESALINARVNVKP